MISFEKNVLKIDGDSHDLEWPIRDAVEDLGKVYVLLDPDVYLADADYKAGRRAGVPAIRNLLGMSKLGERLWSAELPESSDYYHAFASTSPLVVYSFSSHKCEIDVTTGSILVQEDLK